MITDKEFADAVHLSIHSVRLLSNYKSSELERRISKLVIEKFSQTCRECREVSERIKSTPPQQNKSFLKKIGEAIEKS